MLLSHLYQQRILSGQFITKQLHFQKSMYSLIAKNCIPQQKPSKTSQIAEPQSYHSCAKFYKQQIKHFGLLAELLIQERSKELKTEVTERCLKFNHQDQILNCVNKTTENIIVKNFQKDFVFLDLTRQELLKNGAKKSH